MTSNSNKPRFYKRWSFWLIVFVATPALLAAIVLMTGANRYADKLAELRANHRPTNLKELEDYYAIPEGTGNATQQWVTAIKSLDESAIEAVVDVLPYIGNPNAPQPGDNWEQLQAAQTFVAEQADTYWLIREAIATEGAIRFDIDFTLTAVAPLQQVQDLRQLTRLLCLDSAVAFEGQDYNRVLENTLGIFRMANACRYESTLISHLIRNALLRIATEQTNRYASLCDWDDDQLLALQQCIAKLDCREAYRRVAFAEQAFSLDVMDNMSFATVGKTPQLMLIESNERRIESLKEPWHKIIEVHEKIDAEFRSRSGLVDKIRMYPLQLLAMPGDSVAKAFARSAARQRCSIVGLAAARQRRSEGDVLKSLDQIPEKYFPSGVDSELLVDPFTGQPLIFAATDAGLKVYSVGEDGEDNLGELFSDEDGSGRDIGLEITFEVTPKKADGE